MRTTRLALVFAAGILAGCMAGGIPAPAQNPAGGPGGDFQVGPPLLLDCIDLRLGTTVQYQRIPTVTELADLNQLPALAHVVIALPAWPTDYAPLQPLDQVPYNADVVVILPGFPPTRGAAEVWGLVNARLRLVVVVSGPPPSLNPILDLNSMRSLERVIVQNDYPSRSGFERLQRPMSFRKIVP
jgi:hypothetical protein